MKRYYFYKRDDNFREDLKGKFIAFELQALYGETCYSQKDRKQIMHFKYFDQISLIISTKIDGYYNVRVESGTDGCHGHYARTSPELKKVFAKDQYQLISEKQYFRLRKLAMHTIFKRINFFSPEEGPERHFFYNNHSHGSFYDLRLLSTSAQHNIRNYDEDTLEFYRERNLKLRDLRIDEHFRLFISKDPIYKTDTFEIVSAHFNPYYEDLQDLEKSHFFKKDHKSKEVTEYEFERLKRFCKSLILERSSLDQSDILQKQEHTITVLDI